LNLRETPASPAPAHIPWLALPVSEPEARIYRNFPRLHLSKEENGLQGVWGQCNITVTLRGFVTKREVFHEERGFRLIFVHSRLAFVQLLVINFAPLASGSAESSHRSLALLTVGPFRFPDALRLPTGALPRIRLAVSATGSASPNSTFPFEPLQRGLSCRCAAIHLPLRWFLAGALNVCTASVRECAAHFLCSCQRKRSAPGPKENRFEPTK